MPIGAFRLNSISKVPSITLAGARSQPASITSSNSSFTYSTAKFGSNSLTTGSTTNKYYTITVNPADSTWYFTSNKAWTIEFWVNVNVLGTESLRTIFTLGSGGLSASSLNIRDTVANGTWQLNFNNNTTYLGDAFPSPGSTSQNTWYHIAMVSDGTGNIKYFANGTQLYSGSVSITGTNRSITFGHNGTYASTVFFDEVRVSNIARYSGSFSLPPDTYYNDSSTLALFNMNNSNVDDTTSFSRTPQTFTAQGNAQVSTSYKVYGTASAYFDGVGDYLVSSLTNQVGFGTGDFTMECWIRAATLRSQWFLTARTLTSGYYGNGLSMDSTGKISWTNGSTFATTSSSITANTWNHIAVSRSSGTLKIFINGTQGYSGAQTADLGTQTRYIGIGATESGEAYFFGYIDEVRISNIARYTSNFNTSSIPFTNDPYTRLLMHMDGSNGSTTFTDDTA